MEDTTTETTIKVYQEKAIGLGTFIGGPLISGYMLAENFKAFNEPGKAKTTWLITIIVSILLFGSLSLQDDVIFPNYVVPFLNIGIAYLLVQRFQKANIVSHFKNGGQLHSWKRVISVSLLGLLVTVLIYFTAVVMLVMVMKLE